MSSEHFVTKILHGEGLAKKRQLLLRERIARSTVKPVLGVVLIGVDPDNENYRAFQDIAIHDVGIMIETLALPLRASERKIGRAIRLFNEQKGIHGILLQHAAGNDHLPVSLRRLCNPEKDVDCLHPRNIGLVALGEPYILPSVTHAIWTLMQSAAFRIEGQHVVVLGHDDIVAKPTAMFLWNAHTTVSLVSPDDPGLEEYTRRADILVSSVNRPRCIRRAMVRAGAAVIDAGATMNRGVVQGDADLDDLQGHVRFCSAVPGGLEALTMTALLENTWHAYCHFKTR